MFGWLNRNAKFNVIEGVALSHLCDYSFGDQAGVINKIKGSFMKKVDISNRNFITQYNKIKSKRNYMTIFIDNVRLYRRDIKAKSESDQRWINTLLQQGTLLEALSQLDDMDFILFTNLEDTPIDEYIQDKISKNILSIHAVNAVFFHNKKIHPFPYGLQRKLHWKDRRLDVIQQFIKNDQPAENLLYVNHSIKTNVKERSGIKELFVDKKWAKVEVSFIDYKSLLMNVKKHKFMICPIGNAVDCHRNWETIYLRRVPVMKKNAYLEYLFKDFPVLFVNEYSDVTQDLLIQNNELYEKALIMSFDKLDLIKVFNGIVENDSKEISKASTK